jgi:hypothetical protein
MNCTGTNTVLAHQNWNLKFKKFAVALLGTGRDEKHEFISHGLTSGHVILFYILEAFT